MVSVWVTCTSPVNIAVIKYWGKRDVKLNLPINSSLSGTLSQEHLKTSTTVVASDEFEEDKLYLNGKEEKINERTRNCLRELRERAREYRSSPADPSSPSPPLITPDDWKNKIKLHIYSYNNFPTAAGLASSASGLCCLGFPSFLFSFLHPHTLLYFIIMIRTMRGIMQYNNNKYIIKCTR